MVLARVNAEDWHQVSGDAEFAFLVKVSVRQQGIDLSKPFTYWTDQETHEICVAQR
jgi:P2-related tail formation protein